jgi:serine/threonine protein kinase
MVGEQLSGGWVADQKVVANPDATGGFFSVGYTAKHADGREAFLKALDFYDPLTDPNRDPVVELQNLLAAYQFECDVLDKCRNERLSRVVIAIEKGTHRFQGENIPVPYLLFEKADGDVRAHLHAAAAFDTAWALRTLHQVAVGLSQLHKHGIAHQDMKPSNVLMFGSDSSKIADFGRSDYRGHSAPHESAPCAGDQGYAPPELLYGQVDPSWEVRRQACDLYHLGSLILFFFADANTTSAILNKVDPLHWPRPGGPDYSTALPFVREAFSAVTDELEASLQGDARDDLVLAFRELCDPDPALRGHPKARIGRGSPYALNRYVSRLDLLARRAEMGMLEATRR